MLNHGICVVSETLRALFCLLTTSSKVSDLQSTRLVVYFFSCIFNSLNISYMYVLNRILIYVYATQNLTSLFMF